MDLALLTDILDQCFALGMRSLKITGGEPFLYDSFMGLLEYLKKKKKRQKLYLYIETNGTLIDRRMASSLAKAGMKFASVSIDGDNADTHDTMRGVKGAFRKAWQAAKFMIAEDIPVQIITAVYRGNVGQFENVARMAEDIKAESLKANIINIMGRGAEMAENNELLSIEEALELNKKIDGEYRKKFNLRLCSSLPVAFRSFGRMLKEKTTFCGIKGLLGILATGKVSICGIGEEIEELVLGDARTDAIKNIWSESPLLWNIRDSLPSGLGGVCKICVFKNYCLGHCVAHTYYRNGSFTAPFWLCQEAYERGLFPKTRLLKNEKLVLHNHS